MADWDADRPRLRRKLAKLMSSIRSDAVRRLLPTAAMAKAWQAQSMAGLSVPSPAYVGAFRGEPGLENVGVKVGNALGSAPGNVAAELRGFEARLQRVVAVLDSKYPRVDDLDADGLSAVIDLAAWAHAQWIRIHPLANGNGRTARLWANHILMRYGVPPAIRLRPRPDGGYVLACADAMKGKWEPTAAVFLDMVRAATAAIGAGKAKPV